MLYLLGVVSSIGALRASGVDEGQGLALIPLEEHLRKGVGILLSWTTVLLAGAFALMYVGARSGTSGGSGEPAVLTRFWNGVVVLVVLLCMFAMPWTIILVMLLVVVALFASVLLPRWLGGRWEGRRAEIYVATMFVTLALVAGLDAYFRSDPLPRAVVTVGHSTLSGSIIATDGGFVYLAPQAGHGLYRAVPVARVTAMSTVRQRRMDEPSVLNLLGIDWLRPREGR